jgi:hypothetical protein
MSQKSAFKLKRRDKLYKINSYINIYDTNELSSINKDYHLNILRIIKKTILGTNFCYSYSKNNIFASAIANFVIINTCFVILPQIIFNSINIIQTYDVNIESLQQEDKALLYSNRNNFFFRLTISNFIDITIMFFLVLFYKYKEKKISEYMRKYTQFAIKEENDQLIKNNFFCKIENSEFDLDIKKIKKKINNKKCTEDIFFKYVINFPNVRGISNFLYDKCFNLKEKEIVNNINAITDEIDYKYKKKLVKFIILIISILVCIPIFSYNSPEKKLNMINYLAIFPLFLFVQCNIFLANKNEQINYVNLLNERFIKDGYFIYINNDIVSIFCLKEEYTLNGDISFIRNINEKLMEKYGITF